ncbi:MAG: RDD family protein [Pyrinomonadaceae bacterium]
MNDSVREEVKVVSSATSGRLAGIAAAAAADLPPQRPRPSAPAPMKSGPVAMRKVETAALRTSKTSPTLVGFQNKNAPVPEWRLQMQNAVQKRKGIVIPEIGSGNSAVQFPVNGSAALKVEPALAAEPIAAISNPRVAAAMRRIEESRKSFLGTPELKSPVAAPIPQKSAVARPFNVVPPTSHTAAAAALALAEPTAKPILVPSPILEKRNTNKLPALGDLVETTAGAAQSISEPLSRELSNEFAEIKRIRIRAENAEVNPDDAVGEEIEDLAPFSMRFSAGLFDLIITGFASLLLLSPAAFMGAEWLTGYGALAILGMFAFVTFLYMTICLGFFGKSMGMRLFSLELVDAAENEYPSMQQAAINSSVFLLSLGFAGAGFLTVFFNEERRAVHDLLSGTILVREF